MYTLVLEAEPTAAAVQVTDEWLTVDLADGRTLRVPLHWYPRLVHATPAERDHWRLLGGGYAVEWPDLDEYNRCRRAAGRPAQRREPYILGTLAANTTRHFPCAKQLLT